MAPAGSYEALQAAVQAGADAVYFGVGQLNMRSKSAANFTPDDLEPIVEIARAAGVRTYLTVNTVVYEDELRQMHALGRPRPRGRGRRRDRLRPVGDPLRPPHRHGGAYLHAVQPDQQRGGEILLAVGRRGGAGARTVARPDRPHRPRHRRATDLRPLGRARAHRDVRPRRAVHGRLGQVLSVAARDGCSANRGACRQICRRKYTLTDVETARSWPPTASTCSRPKISARSTSSTDSSAPACGCSRSRAAPAVRSMSSGW